MSREVVDEVTKWQVKHKINNSVTGLQRPKEQTNKQKLSVLYHETRASNGAGHVARKYLWIPTVVSNTLSPSTGKSIVVKFTTHFKIGNLDVLNS